MNFAFLTSGGRVVHCNGKLIPHEFPITDPKQITDADGIGRITCTVSSGTARFSTNKRPAQTGGVTQIQNGNEAILLVNLTGSLQNRLWYCVDRQNNLFYLFTSGASEFEAVNTVNVLATQDKSAFLHAMPDYVNLQGN